MASKRVIQINSFNAGSTGRIAREINAVAREEGWQTWFLYGREWKGSHITDGERAAYPWEVLLHGGLSRVFDCLGRLSYFSTRHIIERIEEIQPDVIHLHNLHGYYVNYGMLLQWLNEKNIPVVWTLHDCWPFTGHCPHFDFVGCAKWMTQCYHCQLKKGYPASYVFDNSKGNYIYKRKLYEHCQNICLVPVSQWLSNLLPKSILRTHPKQVIYNGVDTNIFYPREKGECDALRLRLGLEDKIVLLGVALPWGERKGFNDYIELARYLDKNSVIVLVGLDEKQCELLPKNIIGLRKTHNVDEMATLYSMADIVLNLSYEETFGLTTAEGFACGTPGIVYNKTASPELITPETGFIVEPKDYNKIANRIKIIEEKGKKAYIGKCRKWALERYDKEKQYHKYIDLYNRLLNEVNMNQAHQITPPHKSYENALLMSSIYATFQNERRVA